MHARGSRWIERCQDSCRENRTSTDASVEKVSRNKPKTQEQNLNRSTQLLRSCRGGRSILDRSTRYREAIGIAIRKAEEARQTARYRGGIEEVSSHLLKVVFRDVKNTDMNAIQHATQPMIQSTY